MVRFAALLFGALAAAEADKVAPVISLDLVADPVKYADGQQGGHGCARDANSEYCRARSGTQAYGGGTHGFTENFSKTCPAGENTDVANCPVPTARAYDHHDGELSVVQKIYLVNNDGVKGSTSKVYPTIDYKLRSEWLMTFDAEDNAGNKAQQIVFAMILDDTTKPTITPKTDDPTTLEACDIDNVGQDAASRQYWLLPNNNLAVDNYDGDLSNELRINVKAPNMAAGVDYTQSAVNPPRIQVNTHVLGSWTITYSANDHAGMFGTNGQDNTATVTGTVKVVDTKAPELYCNKQKNVFEDGVRSSPNGQGYISSAQSASKEACGDLCEQQQWSRVLGSNAAKNPAACKYFVYEAGAHERSCHLFSSSALTQTLQASASAVGGYPQQCQNANVHECATVYTALGAKCIDMHDSLESDGKLSVTALTPTAKTSDGDKVTDGEVIDNKKTGSYTVTYSCSDLSGNAATAATRAVNVVDTSKPTLTISTGVRHEADASRLGQASYATKGDIDDLFVVQHSAGYTEDIAHLQRLMTKASGYSCTDTCDGSLTDSVQVQVHTGSCDGDKIELTLTPQLLMTPKNYYLKYTCADKALNTVTKCRTIEVVDNTKPVIQVVLSDKMTLEATNDSQYEDAGATCSDQVDGVISDKITVTGDVVKLDTPYTYTVTYNCKDAQGNAALPANRVVTVQDTKCPTCTIEGATNIIREASFPYVDGGATCTDTLDGAILPTANSNVDVETTGMYFVTYEAKDKSNNAACAAYVRTVTVKDTLKPVIALRYEGKLVHTSSVAGNVGANGQANPASTFGAAGVGNPHLENQLMQIGVPSSQSWMYAAITAAVSGVALLAISNSRQSHVVADV